jgi:hypothetical protein
MITYVLKIMLKARTHGYNYLYYHAPNKRERLEMITRSMGR